MFEETREQYFPDELTPGVVARAVDRQTITAIWAELSDEMETPFAELGLYTMPGEQSPRTQLLREVHSQLHHEYILFYDEANKPIGWSYGLMHDAITFFMSWSAILPAYRRRGIYSAFLRHFLPYLQALGYERVTSNHMVTNRPVLIAKLKAGFHVTAVSLDERFGAQVQLTYFFDPDRYEGFAQAFSLDGFERPPGYGGA
ncbi:MAG TPA: GNAT family N-acetyltransferase [Anaerolineae bacterium]